ncbi:unnamed protein product, partial [Prorocentrum cordatum]
VILGIIDEAGQVNEVVAAVSIGIMVDCGPHIVPVDDPEQLPPTVQSRYAEYLGLQVSHFEKVQDSLGEDSPATVLRTKCFGCRPDVLGFPRFAYHDKKIESGLATPLQDRPIVNGLPWVTHRPLDTERLETVAKKRGKDVDEFRYDICDLHTDAMTSGDVHRALTIDNPHADITSNAKSGYANIHE